jgi:hypothetical protein
VATGTTLRTPFAKATHIEDVARSTSITTTIEDVTSCNWINAGEKQTSKVRLELFTVELNIS